MLKRSANVTTFASFSKPDIFPLFARSQLAFSAAFIQKKHRFVTTSSIWKKFNLGIFIWIN
jgi:hypothetical protein